MARPTQVYHQATVPTIASNPRPQEGDLWIQPGAADVVYVCTQDSPGAVFTQIGTAGSGDVNSVTAGLGIGVSPTVGNVVVTADVQAVTAPITLTVGSVGIATFVGSGASHARGAVPDPGASAGTTKFLREDASWQVPSVSSLSLADVAAPQAFVGAAATLGSTAPDADLTLTAKVDTSHTIVVTLPAPRAGDTTILVTTVGDTITVDRATTAGVGTSTANDVKAAIEGDTDANNLIGVAVEGAGTGLVDTFDPGSTLTGGTDNTPATQGTLLNANGVLYFATDDVLTTDDLTNWAVVTVS